MVDEELQGKRGVEFGVVPPDALELTVLVMLDQVVIGIAGEGEGIEHEGIDRGKLQEREAGFCGLQMGRIERDEIVADDKAGACGKVVEAGKCLGQAGAA